MRIFQTLGSACLFPPTLAGTSAAVSNLGDEFAQSFENSPFLLRGESVMKKGPFGASGGTSASIFRKPLGDGLEGCAEQHGGRIHARIQAFGSEEIELEFLAVEADMPWVDLDHSVRVPANPGRIEVGGMKQSREHRLAGGRPVDGKAREFADA